jgi:hypothetical protein
MPVLGTPDLAARLDHPAAGALAAFVAFVCGAFALYWSHRLFHRFPRSGARMPCTMRRSSGHRSPPSASDRMSSSCTSQDRCS